MGGDGGVIASDRRYMRGAGSASHTADSARASAADRAEAEKDAQVQAMQLCAITGSRLDFGSSGGGSGSGISSSSAIVACPFGRLYGREAAVQALLKRMEEKSMGSGAVTKTDTTDLGWQVRGLKDLHPVRFQLIQKQQVHGEDVTVPVCPVTSVELNGLQPAYLIVKTKMKKKKTKEKDDGEHDDNDGPNVLSDRAIKEMGLAALQEEYGPFEKDDMIRLAPPPKLMKEIQSKLQEKRMAEKRNKSSKKKRKKDASASTRTSSKGERMIQDESKRQKSIGSADMTTTGGVSSSKSGSGRSLVTVKTVDDVRHNVAAAVAKSAVLSGLFSNNNNQSNLSEKEKKDKLFASNC